MKAINYFSLPGLLKTSLLVRLTGLVVLVALTSGGIVAVVTIQNSRQALYDTIVSNNRASSDVVAEFTRRYVEDAQMSARELASRPGIIRAVLNNTPEQVEPQLVHFLKTNTRSDTVSIYDTTGNLWTSGVTSPVNRRRSASDREWFQQVIATGKPYLGVPVIARSTGTATAPYGVPIFDESGLVRAVLVMGIRLAVLSDAMALLRSSFAEQPSLVDLRQGGIILADLNPDRLLKPAGGDKEMLRLMLAGKRGKLEIEDSKGQWQLGVFSPVPGVPWAIRILQPIDEAFAPVTEMTRKVIFSVVAVLLLTAAMGWWSATRVSHPLIQLRNAVAGLSGEDGTQRVNFPQADEIGELGRTFNQMADTIVAKEKDLRKANEELEQRVAERTAQLEAANKELEAFSYSVSHDLRAPLRAVDGFSRILLEEHASQLSEEGQGFLRRVRDNAVNMGQLIDDLLTFSRLSRQPLKKQNVVTADLARQVLDELKQEQNGRHVDASVADLPQCEGDPKLLKQVFVNLLSNAFKYTRKREVSRIEVGSEKINGETVYFVKDNGAGFSMSYADKLFGVFQRLHRSEEYEGTGVGLAIVQRVIHRHGGRIWAEATVDKGASFYFTLSGGNTHD
jgi:signal transduction histidine kinase